jgi:hypothetical protein
MYKQELYASVEVLVTCEFRKLLWIYLMNKQPFTGIEATVFALI